jgi:hypothetical protein
MKPLLPMQRLAAGLVACIATGAGAVTLGQAQGTALLGQMLEVTVPIQPDTAGAPVPGCAAAEVFYGDKRVEASQVAADLQPLGDGASLRLRAARPVSARLVIVYLHLGCGERATRKLVLLAEPPQEQLAERRQPPATAPGPTLRPEAPNMLAKASGVAQPSTSAAWRPASLGAKGAPKADAGPRLKLQVLAAAPEAPPRLRLSDTLSSPIGEEPSAQRAAAAALWRVLGAGPDALMHDATRIQSLEQERAGLRATLRRHDAEVAQLHARTEDAEAQRYANPLVYGLAVWSVALGALAAFALMRAGRRRPGWWRGPRGAAESTDFTGFESSMPEKSRRPSWSPPRPQDADLDTIAHDDGAPTPSRTGAAALHTGGRRRDFGGKGSAVAAGPDSGLDFDVTHAPPAR